MYRGLSGYISCPWDSSIDFNINNALACGSGVINVSVNTTVLWAVYYKS